MHSLQFTNVLLQNYDTSESKLQREFEQYGPVKKVVQFVNILYVFPWHTTMLYWPVKHPGTFGREHDICVHFSDTCLTCKFLLSAHSHLHIYAHICTYTRRSTWWRIVKPANLAAMLSLSTRRSETCTVSSSGPSAVVPDPFLIIPDHETVIYKVCTIGWLWRLMVGYV